MKDTIYNLLKELVACDSITCTDKEYRAGDIIYDKLKEIPYFKAHPDYVGKLEIPGDPFHRAVPYGFVRGKSPDTVVLSGHYDVVSAIPYGDGEKLAFHLGKELDDYLENMPLSPVQKEELENGEWIWGRGAADMKAGVVLNLVLTEEYAKLAEEGRLEGSILFMSVPDEESYSAGMRSVPQILKKFKKEAGADYKLLICPEPAAQDGEGRQIMSLGSVGKTLPAIVVQGQVAHIGHVFNGISALNFLTGIYQKTNGSLEFSDCYKGEATMPPTWANLRDEKKYYDASTPERAYGFLTVLSFDTTLDQIIDKLKAISTEVFEDEVAKLDANYQVFKTMNKFETKDRIYYRPLVYTVEELTDMLKERDKDGYEKFYDQLYKEAEEKIRKGDSYPSVTIYMMNRLLDLADIKEPLVLIGVAPPYYPPTHSDMIKGREDFGTRVFNHAKKISEEKYGQGLVAENYFLGISDNSYTYVPEMDYKKLTLNYPMWGKLYSIDFEGIAENPVPSILYGPIGKEYHQWSERVNKHSLFEVMPDMLKEVIKFAWEN